LIKTIKKNDNEPPYKNKIRKQQEASVILKSTVATKVVSKSNSISAAGNSVESETQKESVGKKKTDGRLVVLQEWTQLSFVYGEGAQTLQLVSHTLD